MPDTRPLVNSYTHDELISNENDIKDKHLLSDKKIRPKSTINTAHSNNSLNWKSLKTVSTMEAPVNFRGQYFPAKLAMSAGLIKLLLAFLMVGLGMLSIMLDAALSSLGGGLWVGTVVGVSGFLGVCAARRPHVWVYVLGFMTMGGISMASSGILVVLSATAWARDNEVHTAVFFNKDNFEEVQSLGEVLLRRPSVLVSGALVVFGVVDCLVSLACIVISAREACGIYTPPHRGLVEGHNRKERLYRWLGQQKTIFPMRPAHMVSSVSQFVPLSSSDTSSSGLSPTKTFSTDPTGSSSNSSSNSPRTQDNLSPRYPKVSSANQRIATDHRIQQKKTSRVKMPSSTQYISDHSLLSSSHSLLQVSQLTPSSKTSHAKSRRKSQQPLIIGQPPPSVYHSRVMPSHAPRHHRTHHRNREVHRPFIQPMQHAPPHTAHPSLFYPHLVTPMMPYYPIQAKPQDNHHGRRKHKKERHQKTPKKKEKKDKKRIRKYELTDEQIEKTYTGLDRDIAEGFIKSSMEPGISINRAIHSSFEQDSF